MKLSWFVAVLVFFMASQSTFLAIAFGVLAGMLIEQVLWGVLWCIERLGAVEGRMKWRPTGAPPLTPCPGCRRREATIGDLRRTALVALIPEQRQAVDDVPAEVAA